MLKTNSYHNSFDKNRRLLELFCACDSSVSLKIDNESLLKASSELIHKLLVLVSVYGTNAAKHFLVDLKNASAEDACKIATSYLEFGHNTEIEVGELQQELLHFSRILDLEGISSLLGSKTTAFLRNDTTVFNKRMRKSKYIPSPIKVLLELVTVVIERNISRGNPIDDMPYQGISSVTSISIGDQTFSFPDKNPEYLLAVSFPKNGIRRDISYLYKNILSYVGPRIGLELVALQHCFVFGDISGLILEVMTFHNGSWVVDSICGSKPNTAFESARQLVPLRFFLSDSLIVSKLKASSFELNKVNISFDGLNETQFIGRMPIEATISELESKVLNAVNNGVHEKIHTMETGHLHLDRLPSKDQEIGIYLGSIVSDKLKDKYGVQPLLTPMYDDDHVLVKTRPKEYMKLFYYQINSKLISFIPESSPILKAICVALFIERVHKKMRNSLYLGGNNLYLRLDNTFTVELFENFHGACDVGCIFFESALLIYRSHIKEIDSLFIKYFPYAMNIHENIHSIWNNENQTHDEKVEKIRNYYNNFSKVTNPHKPNVDFIEELIEIIKITNHAHVNVLEDYYEVQQQKVRIFLEAIAVNIRLYSIHFNRFTGRVVVNS